MADINSNPEEQTEALLLLLGEIVGKAALVAELCNQACSRGGDASLDAAAAELAAHIGWMADEAQRRHGRVCLRGGAQEWLLSPDINALWDADKPRAH